MYIGQAARLSGSTVKSIRHYEAIGLLPPPQRQGKYRIYTPQNVELLMFIKCAQQLGFKLKEMQAMFEPHRGEALPWALVRVAITDKKRELMDSIGALQRRHCALEAFEASLENAQDQCRLGSL
ncbi:MerR family transcriptional regulator [Pseudomonas sp. TH41]|uniref:MerR family transcriptional regulator n=1 Tax=Pseudomonas sp. TH41 TaxID=2796405 RepID=UPI001912306D|nr:MerR family transcriptional regulator [Pseudomonas sp. TH41]MBK5352676.1 MerR family transcriptional regulator [Pseudomonas sp. TH41]